MKQKNNLYKMKTILVVLIIGFFISAFIIIFPVLEILNEKQSNKMACFATFIMIVGFLFGILFHITEAKNKSKGND